MSDKTLMSYEARDQTATELPLISVIVPVRNEEDFIAQTLDGLLAQDYGDRHFEIIVVDGQSTDQTCEIVRGYVARHDCVRLLDNPRRWSSAARNIGVRASRGDIILIVDGHCEFENNRYLRELSAAFQRSQADCIGRPQSLHVTGATDIQRAIAAARESWLGHHPDSYIYSNKEQIVPAHSVGVAYRRKVFDKVGLFDESFDACEDVEFNHRVDLAGMICLLAPTITLRYHPRSGMGALFRQLMRYGRGRLRLLRKHRQALSVKTLLPAVLVAGLILGAIAAVFSRTAALIYLGAGAIYLAVLLAVSLWIAGRRQRWRLVGWLPIAFLTIHVAAGWGILYELLSVNRQRGGEKS